METTHANSPVIRSEHPARAPRLYRLKYAITLTGLSLIGLALIGEALLLALGVAPGGSALLLVIFTAALGIPLIIGAVLTPPLVITDDGLILYPMFGGPHPVAWDAICALRPYTLLPVDEPFTQIMLGKANMPRRAGYWVLVQGGLPVTFRLAAWLTGLGNQPVFAVTAASHHDYDRLEAALLAQPGLSASPELAE